MKVGEFFVRTGIMKQEEVDNVLRMQKAGDKRVFGVIAMKLGYIGEDALKKYLRHLEEEFEKVNAAIPHVLTEPLAE